MMPYLCSAYMQIVQALLSVETNLVIKHSEFWNNLIYSDIASK